MGVKIDPAGLPVYGIKLDVGYVQFGRQTSGQGRFSGSRTSDNGYPHQLRISPNSVQTASVSAPNRGGWRRMLLGDPVNLTGGFIAR